MTPQIDKNIMESQEVPVTTFRNSYTVMPKQGENGWPVAVIAGAFQTGVLAMRSLTRHRVKAVCFDCNSSMPGFRSVHGMAHLCPNPDSESEAWLQFMLELARKLGDKPVLIPSSDQYITAIARYSDILQDSYRLSPGITLQGLLAQKQTQYQLAAKHKFPMPRTRFVHAFEEVNEFIKVTTFPCILKPNHFREWQKFPAGHPLSFQKIFIAGNEKSLLEGYRLASEVNSNVIMQEIIQGDDRSKRVYLSCYNSQSQRIANAMFRELRCDPMGYGPASVSEPVDDPEVDEVCDRFLRNIGYIGVCEIEMKWDSRDGQVKLIEVNPRLSGGGDAAPYAGVDLPWIHYLDLIGQSVQPVSPNGKQFKHVVLRADANAIPAYRKAGLITWREILRSYRPPLAFYDLDWKDWRYSIETILISVRSLIRGIVKTSKKNRFF
jgi:predicted ATP-grasp superfamily ATP-dependent carboligase